MFDDDPAEHIEHDADAAPDGTGDEGFCHGGHRKTMHIQIAENRKQDDVVQGMPGFRLFIAFPHAVLIHGLHVQHIDIENGVQNTNHRHQNIADPKPKHGHSEVFHSKPPQM